MVLALGTGRDAVSILKSASRLKLAPVKRPHFILRKAFYLKYKPQREPAALKIQRPFRRASADTTWIYSRFKDSPATSCLNQFNETKTFQKSFVFVKAATARDIYYSSCSVR